MQRLFFYGVLLVLVISCKQEKKEVAQEVVSTFEIDNTAWPKKVAIDSKVKPIIVDWKEFDALEDSFDALYTVENTEDLTLVIEDLEVKQKALAKSRFPKEFDLPQIKGRLTLFNTFLLKVKGDLYYRLDVQDSVLEMINAYNALRNQFTIIVNNTLDKNLILEE
ncbi:hypothetical protein FGM00_15860 [Aggregatimonas sangjinii]|uniref:Uncharacterized protein n=1 Tax=Aggregatimonas sangjinii TaxID=2583587 RepID=A0A5B7SXQ5_9FLAO|nr:hypothetical protein [Aggregatimonas sangjinii]QCX01510.1 hypothetical protein FGM00_15860 [Aggregatimonas sangjinii]